MSRPGSLVDVARRAVIRPGILHIAGRTWFVEPVPAVPGVLFTDRRMVAGVAIDAAARVIRVYSRAPLALLHAVAYLRRAGEGVEHG